MVPGFRGLVLGLELFDMNDNDQVHGNAIRSTIDEDPPLHQAFTEISRARASALEQY